MSLIEGIMGVFYEISMLLRESLLAGGWQTLELVNKSPHEARVFLGVSGKARESQYLGV